MKKRILSVLLAVVMVCSVAGCGKKNNHSNSDYSNLIFQLENGNYDLAREEIDKIEADAARKENQKEDDGKIKRDNEGVVVLTPAQFRECAQKVDITKDNWAEYFEDRREPYHEEDVNAFDEVTDVREGIHFVFGVKEEYDVAVGKDIAFKFNGRMYESDRWDDELEDWVPCAREQVKGQQTKEYDIDGNYLGETEYEEIPEEDFYVEIFGDQCRATGSLYTDYECLNATGELILVNIPAELWTEVDWRDNPVVRIQLDQYNTVTVEKAGENSWNNFDDLAQFFSEK